MKQLVVEFNLENEGVATLKPFTFILFQFKLTMHKLKFYSELKERNILQTLSTA